MARTSKTCSPDLADALSGLRLDAGREHGAAVWGESQEDCARVAVQVLLHVGQWHEGWLPSHWLAIWI